MIRESNQQSTPDDPNQKGQTNQAGQTDRQPEQKSPYDDMEDNAKAE